MKHCLPIAIVAVCASLAACQTTFKYDPATTYQADDGRGYRLERLEKRPGGFARVGARTLRYFPVGTYELEREDETHFYVRQYLPVAVSPVRTADDEPLEAFQLPQDVRYAWLPFDRGLPRSGQWRDGFAVADINDDGHMDIVFGPARKSFGGPAIFLGDSKGNWSRWSAATFPPLAYDYGGAAVADFDLDGKPDIALATHLRGLAVLRGTETTGVFTRLGTDLPFARTGEPIAVSARRVVAFDWRGDRRPAIVALNEMLATSVADRVTDGVMAYEFVDGKWTRVKSDPRLQRATSMAISREGQSLLVSRAPSSDGLLTLSTRSGGSWLDHNIRGLPRNAVLTAIAATQSGNDRAPEFAIAWRQRASNAWWSRIAVVRQQSGRTWQMSVLSTLPDAVDVSALAFAKLQHDGPMDLVSLDSRGHIRVFRQRNDSSFVREQDLAPPEWRRGCQGYDLQAKDLDGDGIDELVLAFAGESSALTRTIECANGGAIQAFKLAQAKP